MQGLSVIYPTPRLYSPAVELLLARDSNLIMRVRGVVSLDSSLARPRPLSLLRPGNQKQSAISVFPAVWREVEMRDVRVRARHGCRLGMPLTPCVRGGL